ATFITLLLVPVLYAIFVKDLKWVAWKTAQSETPADAEPSEGRIASGPDNTAAPDSTVDLKGTAK
ncbi:MAG: hypothetical protein JWL77_5872, partial [Chthonomonadaceae bacterium]|nr:hypothetical protein [Chthonomonadaceae bacterium]